MAVFTAVDNQAFADWAKAYGDWREITALSPIAEGIENTNYRFSGDGKPYVFTIFEVWGAADVAYYHALSRHLNAAAMPVPAALGAAIGDWHGKPCLITPFMPGQPLERPDESACRIMGGAVAGLHRATGDFGQHHANPRGGDWRRQTAEQVRPFLNEEQQRLLQNGLACDEQFSAMPLPRAACHCDLFRNNVLWENDTISAVIDFYFGGDDALLFDLAVCACDWCYAADDGDGTFLAAHLHALLDGYSRERTLCDLEKRLVTDALTVAALRFWLSRLWDVHFPRQAQQLTPHDPRHFENILRAVQRDSVKKLLSQVA